MGKSGKKPRAKMNARKFEQGPKKESNRKEDDWGFDEIARSKTRRRY